MLAATSEAKESASLVQQKYQEVRPMSAGILVVMLKIAVTAGYTLWFMWYCGPVPEAQGKNDPAVHLETC